MISAAPVLPGVSSCKDWSNLSLNVTALRVITGCNQRVVCRRCCPPTNSQTDPGRSLFSAADEKQDVNIISLHYPALFGSLGRLPRSLPSLCRRCQTDRAVQLLLETSADNPSYYCDSLKACLVTTITSSGPSQSTIKLVATNMIANGKLAGIVTICLGAAVLNANSTRCVGVCRLECSLKSSN